MKKSIKVLLVTLVAALPFLAMPAQAQTKESCNADAKAQNLQGADLKMFMKECLPAGAMADKPAKSKAKAKGKSKKGKPAAKKAKKPAMKK